MDENEVFTPLITLVVRSSVGWWRKKSGSKISFNFMICEKRNVIVKARTL